jgi:signal transduction histidine kinase/DNA-binding response OmpR family regulator
MPSLTPRTFARKLQVYVGAVACSSLAMTIWLSHSARRDALETRTHEQAMTQVKAAAEQLDAFVNRIGTLARAIAARQRAIGPRPDPAVMPFLVQLVRDMPVEEVYGVYVAFDGMRWDEPLAMPWVDRKSFPNPAQIQYDYHQPRWEWYNAPKATRRFNVTEPYFDEGGSNITMVSLNAPIIADDGTYIGTAGADLQLEHLMWTVKDIHLRTETGQTAAFADYAYVVSRAGRIIAHPNKALMPTASSPGADVHSLEDGRLVAGQPTGATRLTLAGDVRRLYWFQAPLTGWKVVLNAPESLVLGPVNRLTARHTIIALLGVGLIVILVTIVARRMTEPVSELTAAAEAIEAGRFDPAALRPLATRPDELGGLAHAFQTMGREIQLREQRLAEWNKNLETTVAERTSALALAASEADQARNEAELANRTKSAFLANMSHELRTPMNAILGYSEMLIEEAEEGDPQSLVADLQKINAAGKHLLALINDVLDLSKIEAGKMTLFVESFDVSIMLAEVVSTIAPLVEKNGNVLEVRCPKDAGTMRADLTKVRQTLFNLLSNATKFTSNGRILIEVERQGSTAGELLIFRVSDTGIGMTDEQMGRLFEAFSQADTATARKYGGTGLGLAISRRFCRMLGGDITVGSKYGAGTTFTVTLPGVVTSESQQSAAATAAGHLGSASPQAAAQPAPRGPLVLVIDDDAAARDLLERHLTKDGYRVRLAADGQSGLALARELKPDVIALDVMMPGMDGWAVLAELRKDPELHAMPVIMASMLDNREMGLALSADEYLTKPLDRARLQAALRRLVHSRQSRTVLVVDDDPSAREVAQRALQQEGWQVATAENGRVALERIAESRPALVLLDLLMPEMDGFEFLHELRRHSDCRDLPVIVQTAKDLTPADLELLQRNVQKVLQKGAFAREELWSDVRALVRQHVERSPTPERVA